MRFMTTILAVCFVASILAAQAFVYAGGDDAREKRAEIDEKYDIDGYHQELKDNGLDDQDHSRLYPGSIGMAFEGPACAEPSVPATLR